MNQPMPLPVKPTGSSKCLVGCLVAAGVMVLLLVVGGIFIWKKGAALVADMTHQAIEQAVNQSDLPPEQKTGIMTQATDLRDDFKSGRIGMADVGRVAQELSQGPILPMINIWVVSSVHIKHSRELSAEEKEDAKLQIQRFSRGVFENKISPETVSQVMEPVTEPAGQQGETVRSDLTEEELRKFIAELRAKADAAGIPNEAYHPDIAGELKKAIDKALNRGSAPAAQPAEPVTY